MSVGAIRAGRAMVEIFADSSMLSRGLATAQGKMAKFASTLRRLGTAQVVVGASFAAPIAAAVVEYAKLESRINTVRALTGANAKEMRGLSDQIRRVGMATGISFTQVADAMADLSRAGVKVGDLGKATRVVADFSRAAGVDMARAANIGVEILTQFGLTMEHLPRVADVLQEMANATVSTVEELSDGFRYAGQSASMFGLSLEETAAAIAYLQQSGLSASTAGTSLNQMLLQVVQNMDKLEAAIGGIRGADGEFLEFEQVLRRLQEHLRGMPGPERMKFLNEMFDVRGMRGAHGLLKNIEEWMRLTAMAQASTGATARKAQEMAKSFVVSFEKMRNGVVLLGYAIGEALDKDLRFAFDSIGRVSSTLAEFVKTNQGAVQAVAKTAAALVASGVAFFTAGLAIQLALFSLEGFVKVASGIAGVVAAPFKMLGGVVSFAAGMVALLAGRLVGLARLGGAIVAGLFMPLAAGLAGTVAFFGRLLVANVALLAVLPRTLANLAAIAVGTARLTAVFAVGALAQPVLALAAALAAAAVAAAALQRIGPALVSVFEAAGNGAGKIWSAFVGRATTAWPAIVSISRSGWQGVWDAIESGDISLAWQVFASAASAAFAQVMTVLGPFVDDAAEMLRDVGVGLYRGIEWAVKTAGDLFLELRSAAEPVFAWLGGIGEWIIGGLAGVGEAFSSLGDYAEEGGNRIYDALNAGDIVSAWAAAITAIQKMMIDLGSWWDLYVAQPVRLFGQEMGNSAARDEIGRAVTKAAGAGAGRDVFGAVTPIMQARTQEQLAVARVQAQTRFAGDARGNEEARAAIALAERTRDEELRAAGVRSPRAQDEERQRQIDQAEADFQRKQKERSARRAQAAKERRDAADAAKATVETKASVAGEPNRNRAIEQAIDTATKPEQLAAAQRMIEARARERDAAERGASMDQPKQVAGQMDIARERKSQGLHLLQARRDAVSEAVNSGALNPKLAEIYNAQIDQADAAVRAATTAEEVLNATADQLDAAAETARTAKVNVPTSGGFMTPDAATDLAKKQRVEAGASGADLAAAQAADNAARQKEAIDIRSEAADARRRGNEEAAAALERIATRLEQALDQKEEADLNKRLNAQREELLRQDELRNKAVQAGEEGRKAVADKRLDAIGGFMNGAFDRIGFGNGLTDRAAAAGEATARGVGQLVQMARNGGIFIG